MKKRLVNGILLGTAAMLCAGGFAACKGSDGNNGGAEKTQIEEVYESYVAYAEENGKTPLSYEEWLASIKGEKGDKGKDGANGKDGKNGVDGKDGTNGKDGVNGTNGKDGKDGADGKTPYIGANGNWWIGETDTGVKAAGKDGTNGVDGTNGTNGTNGKDGDKGEDGRNGLSAYELYLKYHPEYTKSEQEWLQDLAAGYLHSVKITLDSDGGEISETNLVTAFGSFVKISEPRKNGYDFVGWNLNGTIIDTNTYVFFADCTLKAVWKASEEVVVSFNPDGGVVSVAQITVEYGKEYTLPVPSKEKQTFAGWFYENTEIAQSGVWNYTHENIELTAKWNKTNIYANLSVDEAYGAVEKSKVTLAIGDYYSLPVPSSLQEGKIFQGWYYGDEKVTDADGKSFKKCLWDSTVTLTAAYYTEIGTIYQFMDLAGKDLTGDYIITNDLDFKGLGVNYINSLSGTFDGGGHTLKNFVLSTGATFSAYSGLFREVKTDSKICNLFLENISCNEEYASGLAGITNGGNICIENIAIKNSFNNTMQSVLVGLVARRTESQKEEIVTLNNITVSESGKQALALGIYSQRPQKIRKEGFSDACYTNDYYPSIKISGFYVDGQANKRGGAAGLLYEIEYSYTAQNYHTIVQYGKITIANFVLEMDIENGIISKKEYDINNNCGYWGNIFVQKSEIHSKTTTAWGGVDELCDSIHTGTTQNWGAKKSVRCIDTGAEIGSYDLGTISSSIILYPDANEVYTYYSSSGTQATFKGSELIEKNLFISMLGFEETIWNLENIDIKNGIYPTIRKAEQ